MSEQTKDGGPAFPMASDLSGHWSGMSLRDWFAGQALAGILANAKVNAADGGYSPAMAAADAFTTADAMLAARGK